MHFPLVAHVSRGHVLPYEDAFAVAVVVPARRLDLHVLADHVVTQLLGLQNVEQQRFVGRCGEKSVGPPALVERAEVEERFVVERHAEDAALVALGSDLAHGGVRIDLVDGFPALPERHFHVVEERRVGAPEFRLDAQTQRVSGKSRRRSHELALVEDLHLHQIARRAVFGRHGYGDVLLVQVGNGLDARDVALRHRFDPHGLPDAADRRVPDAVGGQHLLSAGLVSLVRAVEHAYDQLLPAFGLEIGGDVERKGREAARVRACKDVVHEYVGFPVHRAEVQQHVAAFPGGGHAERAAVPEFILLGEALLHARQRGFDSEGDEDLSVHRFRFHGADGFDGIVPQAVEVHPLRAYHLRTRVFGKHVGRVDLFGPWRLDFVAHGFPLGKGAQHAQRCHGCQNCFFHY